MLVGKKLLTGINGPAISAELKRLEPVHGSRLTVPYTQQAVFLTVQALIAKLISRHKLITPNVISKGYMSVELCE